MKRISRFIPTLIAAIALFVAAFAPVKAALQVPPVSSVYANTTLSWTLWSSKVITTTTSSSFVQLGEYATCGNHVFVVQGGSTNPLTLTMQASNDNANWVDYGASVNTAARIISNSTVAVNDFYSFYVPPAQYARLNATVFNTNPVTISARLFCK